MANYLTTMQGSILGVDDTFIHSLAIASPSAPMVVAESLRNNWQTMWTEAGIVLSARFANDVSYTHATCALINDLTGPVTDLAPALRANFSPALTGSGAGTLPPQVALAISLVAGNYPDGAPVRGRFYLPVPGQALAADGTVSTAERAAFASAMQVWLSRLASEGHTPCVWSRLAARHGALAGFLGVVNSVRVGSKYDTIRSRRNNVPETYSVLPVPSP